MPRPHVFRQFPLACFPLLSLLTWILERINGLQLCYFFCFSFLIIFVYLACFPLLSLLMI